MSPPQDPRPLIAHVIFRLGVGGLENGLVNLINRLPAERYRHAVVCLTDATDFRRRIERDDVAVHELHRRPGHDLRLPGTLFRLFRTLRPAIVHSRNLAAIESQVPAWLAGVPARVHSEHGWDVFDPDGTRRKYQWLRRAHRPFVHRFVGLSQQLVGYLRDRVGVPPARLLHICNGVDTARFAPDPAGKPPIAACPFEAGRFLLIGTVGRMHGVKDQLNLARAFLRLLEVEPAAAAQVRLVMVGDGPLRAEAAALLEARGAGGLAWLPGERADVPDILRGLDLFVLPSQAEGISNTILEAMEVQMKAEREKRAVILSSEGTRDAAINTAEGEKQQVIKASEARRQQQINEAQGQAEAILTVANATAEGLKKVGAAIMMEGGYDAVRLRVAEQYVAQFGQLVQGSTNLVLPANIGDIGSMIALAMNVFNQQSVKGTPKA